MWKVAVATVSVIGLIAVAYVWSVFRPLTEKERARMRPDCD
jgi:hypothetical protein